MIGTVVNIFRIQDLRNRILFTMALLMISRVGYHIPNPGYDWHRMIAEPDMKDTHVLFEGFRVFTGCTWGRNCLFALGLMPYIQASVLLILLGGVIPTLRKLQQEGQKGHKKIQEYTLYMTVLICVIHAVMYIKMLGSYTHLGMQVRVYSMVILGMTAGTVFLVWLGEQINEHGIGKGFSLLIITGIVSRMPGAVNRLVVNIASSDGSSPAQVLFLLLVFVAGVAIAIVTTQGQRRIPVQQVKMEARGRMYGGPRHYLPLHVNHGGVMPIILASSLMWLPLIVMDQFAKVLPKSGMVFAIYVSIRHEAFMYCVLHMLLVFLFAFFWIAIQFQPRNIAKYLLEGGSFIPGLRPGRRTAAYLEAVMTRLTYFCAAFLALIAVIPVFLSSALGILPSITMYLGGARLLFVVGNLLDLVQEIEARLLMLSYDFRKLKKGDENSSLAE